MRPWEPLLEGVDAEHALEVVEATARDIRGRSPSSLAGLQGAAGEAVFWACLCDHGLSGAEEATASLERALIAAAIRPIEVGLLFGCAGVRWTLAQIGEPETSAAALAVLDASILAGVGVRPWDGLLDLDRGPGGVMIAYAGEQSEAADRIVSLSLDVLERADLSTIGSGLAHGRAGVLCGVVHHLSDASPNAMRCRRLTERLTEDLVSEPLPPASPKTVGRGWCHGVAGVALPLLAAARITNRPDLERTAIDAGRVGTAMCEEAFLDAGLCHGTAGLALLACRLYHATGDPVLADHARYWTRRTLALSIPGSGIGGYRMRRRRVPEGDVWEADSTLLVGTSGVALALLAATSRQPPDWDRVLGTDVAAGTTIEPPRS